MVAQCIQRVSEIQQESKRPRRGTIKRSSKTISAELNAHDKKMNRKSMYMCWKTILDSPPPAKWNGRHGSISAIKNLLSLPKGSTGTVRKVLEDAWELHKHGIEYNGENRQSVKPSHNSPMIPSGSATEQLVSDCVEQHISYSRTCEIVNSTIKALNPEDKHVGRSSIKTVVDRLDPSVGAILGTSQGKSKYAKGTPWAEARYQQFQQHRLRMGRVKFINLTLEDQTNPAFKIAKLYPYSLNQVTFWDETQPNCRVGGRGPGPQIKISRRFKRDINGKLDAEGEFGRRAKWMRMKFTKEIRLSLGCAVVKDRDGNERGVRLPPFDYTGKWVNSIGVFEEEVIPKIIRAAKECKITTRWVEGRRTTEDGIYDEDPVTIIKGVAKSKARVLHKFGIRTVRGLTKLRATKMSKIADTRGIGMRSLRKWIEQAETAHMGAYVDHEVCEGEGEGVRESSP